MIELKQVGFARGSQTILHDVNLKVEEGELFGIIGPNGGGKSTLLSLAAGTERLSAGSLLLSGRPITQYSRKEMARLLAVLQQEGVPPIGFTVQEVIEMGRYPFQNWFGDEQDDSTTLIESIMERLDLHRLADRTLVQLSGGERQRVALGKTMAQQPKLLLLDEPTTFLDIGYQIQMMDYVRSWQKEAGLTVMAVLHDLNLAALYCDRIAVLHQGSVYAVGTPGEILRAETVEAVYGTTPDIVSHPQLKVPQILLRPGATIDKRQHTVNGVQGGLETVEVSMLH